MWRQPHSVTVQAKDGHPLGNHLVTKNTKASNLGCYKVAKFAPLFAFECSSIMNIIWDQKLHRTNDHPHWNEKKGVDPSSEKFPGINEGQIDALADFLTHFQAIEEATIYGSRVAGGHREESDLDVALSTSPREPFDLTTARERICSFASQTLGLDVHLKLVEEIRNSDLLHTIRQSGVVIYNRRQGIQGRQKPLKE